MSEEYINTREFVFRAGAGLLEFTVTRMQYGEFISYVAIIYSQRPMPNTQYAIKSFGSLKRATKWAEAHLNRPTMLLLKYQGKVLYDV